MSKKCKYNAEEKLKILMENENCYISVAELCRVYEINNTTFHQWKKRYKKYGLQGLEESKSWKQYSKELKESAVLDYLSREYSLGNIVDKYEISDKSVLRKWIKMYNSHRELKDTGKGMSKSMTKGRTTTLEERIEIVKYCIDNNKNYQLTAEMFNVSYQQVYGWVRKFEIGREDALIDKRGKNKLESELTEEDKIKLAMKRIETENERLRAENAFLKKLQELEGRRY